MPRAQDANTFRRAVQLWSAGSLREAEPMLNELVADDPSFGEAWLVLGHVRLGLGRNPELAWRRASSAGQPEASYALGLWLAQAGRAKDGLALLRHACRLNPHERRYAVGLTDLLLLVDEPPADLGDTLLTLYDTPRIDHTRLGPATWRALAQTALGAEALAGEADDGQLLRLLALPLTEAWLSRALIIDATWERLLTGARSAALRSVERGRHPALRTLTALAIHGWRSEYCWAESPEETALVNRLTARLLGQAPAARVVGDNAIRLAAVLMYRPLDGALGEGLGGLAPTGGEDWGPLTPLFWQQLGDLRRERTLAESIPTLDTPSGEAARAVAALYEENPYPRHVTAHQRTPQRLPGLVRSLLPRLPAGEPLPDPAPARVLLAGCGTGQQLLTSATRLAEREIVALDLSRASLGRAARLVEEWGLQGVSFAQGDLRDVARLNQTFDLIECVGVLHHLDDPDEGLAALVNVLAPGGLMQLGLYSERGRQDVLAARALLQEAGLTDTDEAGLRAARALLRSLPEDHPAKGVTRSPDFASLTGLRDLVLHPVERRYTPLTLGALLMSHGLTVLGIQHSHPTAAARYAAARPDDLAQRDLITWDALEAESPGLFSGMFVLWVKKGAVGA